MSRVFRSLVVWALLLAALFASAPAQAAAPDGVAWQSILSWWESLTAWRTAPGEVQESALSVAVGAEGPSISPDGFTPEGGQPGTGTESTAQTTINPDEPPTEAGPKILPDG